MPMLMLEKVSNGGKELKEAFFNTTKEKSQNMF